MKDKILNLLAYLVLPLIIILLITNICISIFYYNEQYTFTDITNGKSDEIIVSKTVNEEGQTVDLVPSITELEKSTYKYSRDTFNGTKHYYLYNDKDEFLFELLVDDSNKNIKIIQNENCKTYTLYI